jgi:hypothetical protein
MKPKEIEASAKEDRPVLPEPAQPARPNTGRPKAGFYRRPQATALRPDGATVPETSRASHYSL